MINQLIDEPYIDSMDPIKPPSNKTVVRLFVGDLVDILTSENLEMPYCYEYKGSLINKPQDFGIVLNQYPLLDLENRLLEEISFFIIAFRLVSEIDSKVKSKPINFETLSFYEKLDYLEISDYQNDRNLNHLIMYLMILKEKQNQERLARLNRFGTRY